MRRHRATIRLTVAIAVVALLVSSALGAAATPEEPPATGAAPTAGLSTPQLIEQAVAQGSLDQDLANLYLAYALADHAKLPAAYVSAVPWDGTLPLHHLRQLLESGQAGSKAAQIEDVLNGPIGVNVGNCSGEVGGSNNHSSTHFYIEYQTIGGGLTITDYATSLETSWGTEVTTFGWWAPPVAPTPPPGNRYHVVVADLGPGLYGFVSSSGTHAGFVGNNPNTSWSDGDASASCMALNRDYSAFPGTPQQAMDATTAHEFNHSIQFGIGGLAGSNAPDSVFVEGGATWMEDEVFDASNDNHNYLWPDFTRDMGQYTPSPYPYWVVFRAITERYGAGIAGGGEQVMQDFWELTSRNTGNNLTAMQTAVANKGTTLADAYHAAAVSLKFNRPCGGGYVYPYCLEEGALYLAAAGATPTQGSIGSVGGSFNGSVRDNYALNWISLPSSGSTYNITLNNSSAGGQLRASAVCDTGSALIVSAFPSVVGAGGSTTLTGFNPVGCVSRIAVITNQSQTAPNPTSSILRTYTLSTAAGGGGGDIQVAVADFSFTPANPAAVFGDTVQWNFNGPSNHTATDKTGLALFDSGSRGPGATYLFTFDWAGAYNYRCTIHPTQMTGKVIVGLTRSPSSGGTGTTFTISWASGAPPAGMVFDVQIDRPGGVFEPWRTGVTSLSDTFVPDAGAGRYTFRTRLRNPSTGKASKYSSGVAITVT
jgi:plastocyanin